jgi:multidrug resistance efflux pump
MAGEEGAVSGRQVLAAGARLHDAGAGVSGAAAQRDVAQAELDLLKAGVTPEEIAVSAAAARQAEVAVAMAEDALARTEILAPFAGVVTKVNVEAGEAAAQGSFSPSDKGKAFCYNLQVYSQQVLLPKGPLSGNRTCSNRALQ